MKEWVEGSGTQKKMFSLKEEAHCSLLEKLSKTEKKLQAIDTYFSGYLHADSYRNMLIAVLGSEYVKQGLKIFLFLNSFSLKKLIHHIMQLFLDTADTVHSKIVSFSVNELQLCGCCVASVPAPERSVYFTDCPDVSAHSGLHKGLLLR